MALLEVGIDDTLMMVDIGKRGSFPVDFDLLSLLLLHVEIWTKLPKFVKGLWQGKVDFPPIVNVGIFA